MANSDTIDQSSGIKVQVGNARPEDSGRGLARIPRAQLAALSLNEGTPPAGLAAFTAAI